MHHSMLQVFCLLFPLAITSAFAQSCTSIGSSSCICRLTDSGKVIDLSSIASNDGNPSFPLIFTNEGTCSYNPCHPFTINPGVCDNVAGCVMVPSGDFYSLGTQESAYFTNNGDNVAIHYYDETNGRGMLVTLICHPDATSPEVISLGTQGNTYEFQLVTRCACGDGCYDSSSKDGGDNVGIVGIILILLLIFGFALYFGIGITWRKTKHDAEGWDVIPNKEFWQDLPHLVKDGCILTVQPVIYAVNRIRGSNESEEKNPIVNKDNEQSPYNYGT